jgi:quercetin dioxygenase-like cupin family protein
VKTAPAAHFFKLGEVDVDRAEHVLGLFPAMWSKISFRQEHPLSPHKDTSSIYLRWPADFTAYGALHARDSEDKEPLRIKAFAALLRDVENTLDRRAERAMFVKLCPGGRITPHIDQGLHAEATNRYHIAIASNVRAWLRVEDTVKTIPPGEVWFFNKHAMHSAGNDGPTDRIHLIVDTLK